MSNNPDGRPRRFSDEDLLNHLVYLDENVTGNVSHKDLQEKGVVSTQTYRQRFGTFNAAKKKAGLELNSSGGGIIWSKSDVLSVIRFAAEDYSSNFDCLDGLYLNRAYYLKEGFRPGIRVIKRFGGFEQVCSDAGVEVAETFGYHALPVFVLEHWADYIVDEGMYGRIKSKDLKEELPVVGGVYKFKFYFLNKLGRYLRDNKGLNVLGIDESSSPDPNGSNFFIKPTKKQLYGEGYEDVRDEHKEYVEAVIGAGFAPSSVYAAYDYITSSGEFGCKRECAEKHGIVVHTLTSSIEKLEEFSEGELHV